MKILILGAGQVGSTLAENLSDEHDITIIDQNQSQLMRLQQRMDIRTVVGIASHPEVLEDAGAEEADMLIAVTSSDEANLIACQIAFSLFKVPTKVARVRHRTISDQSALFGPGHLAVDTVINPAQLVTRRIKRQIDHPGTLMMLDFAEGLIQMAAVRAIPASPLVGRQVRELCQDLADVPVKLVSVIRNGQALLATDDLLIEAHDEVYYCTEPEHVNTITQILLEQEQRYRRIMLAGGGHIGIALAQALENDYKVKLLDSNTKQCEMAAEQLHKAVVLNGDAADEALLTSENIDEVDLFCSITNDDEANIMSAIVAKRLGAKRTVALVNRQTYAHYLIERSPDIDMAISPQRITGGKLLTFLRKGDMVNVYPLSWCHAEAIEVIAHGDEKSSKIIGKNLADIRLPDDTAVAALLRHEQVIMAQDDVVIEAGDHVILFVGDKRHVGDIEALFQVAPSFM